MISANEVEEPSSNPGLVCCTVLRASTPGKDNNLSLLISIPACK